MSKEYIERDVARRTIEHYDPAYSSILDNVSAADVVEVVRCGECKHITPVEGGLPLCTLHHAAVAYNDYCSYGERKDGAE